MDKSAIEYGAGETVSIFGQGISISGGWVSFQ